MADARPFHWEYQEPPVQREAFRVAGRTRAVAAWCPISGAKNAALKLLAAATLTGERCRFTNVPEIADVKVLVETLADLGVVVDHPAPNTYEVAAGDVDWLFVPLEAAAKMRASFILLGPLLARFGRVIISNPGGDRIGRRPVNLHVDAMRALGADIDYRNGYYFARSPGTAARRGGGVPGRHRDGHRERDARGDARGRPHDHPPRGPGARGGRPHRVPAARWARRSSGRRPTSSRSRAAGGSAAPSTGSCPTASRRARSSSRPPSRAARSPSPAPHHQHLGAFLDVLGDVGVRTERQRRAAHGACRRPPALPCHGHHDRALPRARHGPPAADRGAAHPGQRHEPHPRDDLRGPPRVDGRAAPDGRDRGHHRCAPRAAPRALRGCAARRSR